jgi:hypothetical protein
VPCPHVMLVTALLSRCWECCDVATKSCRVSVTSDVMSWPSHAGDIVAKSCCDGATESMLVVA